jgi:acetyl esterase/lipase
MVSQVTFLPKRHSCIFSFQLATKLLKIGDVDNDQDFNEMISPLFHVDKIKAPLLIGQGQNDPRVKQAEADQIAFSMQEKGIPVEYVLYPDEGHGFARPENRIDFNLRTDQFLAKHLAGGRAEEFVETDGSTARFPLLERGGSEMDV